MVGMLPLGLVKWKQLGFYIKYPWNINLTNTYQFLIMLHKSTVQCRKLWVIWSSLRTKIFNVILCFCHFKVPSIFSSSYILHNPRTHFKGNTEFIFLCNPQKSSVNVCLMKILKSTVTKKNNCVFLLLRCKKLLKVADFVIFSTSIMVLFEICKGSKVTFWTNCPFPLRISCPGTAALWN